MKKALAPIAFLLLLASIASPSFAGPDNESTSNHANFWNGVWQEVKNDWKEIGHTIKDSGANVGHTFKNEFQKMPENFREGCKATKDDFKTFTGSARVNPKEK